MQFLLWLGVFFVIAGFHRTRPALIAACMIGSAAFWAALGNYLGFADAPSLTAAMLISSWIAYGFTLFKLRAPEGEAQKSQSDAASRLNGSTPPRPLQPRLPADSTASASATASIAARAAVPDRTEDRDLAAKTPTSVLLPQINRNPLTESESPPPNQRQPNFVPPLSPPADPARSKQVTGVSDDDLNSIFTHVAKEVANGQFNPGLRMRATVEAEGDLGRLERIYVELWVKQIIDATVNVWQAGAIVTERFLVEFERAADLLARHPGF